MLNCFKFNCSICFVLILAMTHFSLNGALNKQSFRFYANKNPKLIYEQPLHN